MYILHDSNKSNKNTFTMNNRHKNKNIDKMKNKQNQKNKNLTHARICGGPRNEFQAEVLIEVTIVYMQYAYGM